MKRPLLTLSLVAATLAVLTLTGRSLATDATTAQPACGGSCCGGPATATELSEPATNAIPDRLTTCPVSGDKLGGDMGGPYVFVYQGQQVKLCCKGCKKDFLKDPAKYLKTIRAADKK
jgi:YHS domain-containing protein